MNEAVVIMGVAGSGKSSLGRSLAQRLGVPFVEGDAYHSPASLDKMRRGIALLDEDRDGWLDALSAVLETADAGVVLTCSALRRNYRERLRKGAPRLFFVHLEISQTEAEQRVRARAETHFFPVSLLGNQFETLESPVDESSVLSVDATRSLPEIEEHVVLWLRKKGVLDAASLD